MPVQCQDKFGVLEVVDSYLQQLAHRLDQPYKNEGTM